MRDILNIRKSERRSKMVEYVGRIFRNIVDYGEAFLIQHESLGGQECSARRNGGGHLVRSFRAGRRVYRVYQMSRTFSRLGGLAKDRTRSRMSLASMSGH